MTIHLQKSTIKQSSKIAVTGSKSEANRLLILQALYPNIKIENLSNSDDSQLMQKALTSNEELIDIHHAGTAMRFLTAYFSIQKNRETVLTGSSRMKERPIGILVEALIALGVNIEYLEKEGFPPLKIKGKDLNKNKVTLKANVSSQFISALLLIGSQLENGLELNLEGKITSIPYIKMTLSLLSQIGINSSFENNLIIVKPLTSKIEAKTLVVESDWSSASYFYSIVALSKIGTQIKLSSYKENSLQGDSVLAKIYNQFGVTTHFENNTILLEKTSNTSNQSSINLNLSNAPDIAQTISVTAFGLGMECDLTGLHTLKIKETDRLVALKTEIEKFGGKVTITENSLYLKSNNLFENNIDLPKISVETYKDHRMAMAFAPLALRTEFAIEAADVVSKSYPDFWKDLKDIGFNIK